MILLFGNVGSGKGTQAALLAKRLNCKTLSSGEILRQHKDRNDIQSAIAKGELVGDDILLPLIDAEIKKVNAGKNELILDGFPRNTNQAKWLIDKTINNEINVTAIIRLNISKAAAMQRLLSRQRQDDSKAVINQRFLEYEQNVLPAIEYFKNSGFQIDEINGDQPVETVAQQIWDSLKAKNAG